MYSGAARSANGFLVAERDIAFEKRPQNIDLNNGLHQEPSLEILEEARLLRRVAVPSQRHVLKSSSTTTSTHIKTEKEHSQLYHREIFVSFFFLLLFFCFFKVIFSPSVYSRQLD